jgi:BirA family transcriptional regulator, biotin operon repressor / biotin---[acetyl-CoA-carboxylase] ligase
MTRRRPIMPARYRLVCYDSIGSTNDEAKRLARDGAPDGTFVWSLEQTAGRGRRGRTWASPRGNLYTSLISRPDCLASQAAQLSFVAAMAIGEALRAILPKIEGLAYKWPNDVLINSRKTAGILLESEMSTPGKLSFVVIGAGVNLAASPRGTEFPATSIAEEGLGMVRPETMLEHFAHQFQSWEHRWHAEGFAPVRAAWLAAAATAPGAPIRVRLESATLDGRFLNIDEQGALLLDEAGQRRHISAGEVFPANR